MSYHEDNERFNLEFHLELLLALEILTIQHQLQIKLC